MTNVVCQVGIAQGAVAAALSAPDADADVAAATRTWRERATSSSSELADYPVVRPYGGWSLLIDTDPARPRRRPRRRSGCSTTGRVAATAMEGWGPSGERYLRLVFANEPADRLRDLGARFDAAL